MAGDLEFAEPVRRWLRVRSGEDQDDPPFELDDEGFLPDPTADASLQAGPGMVRPEDAVVEQGALVLLGEPGAGKTTTFARLTEADRSAGEPEPGSPGTVWITGSELGDTSSFNEVLGEHLAALPPAGTAEPPTAMLTIILDQLDEAANLFRLPARLKRALNDKDTRALRFLIACRTADYPEGLTRVLEQALGACVVADLAPLTRDDVATLAASTDVDATAFVDAVVRAGVGTLANTPLTLKVLLAAFRQEADALSGTPRELFETGVTHLADEHDRGRAVKSCTNTTVEERLVIAGRIATRMLLCGQRTIWCGEAAQAGPDDITEGMLARGRETAAGSFEVSPAAVGETLRTALFSRSGTNRVAFAHSSFAAFLAARYLTARSSGDADAQRGIAGVFLVAAPDEETASIPIHLRETAAWMLAHAPGAHRWLAAADPEGLIAHGAYITDFGARAAMVDGLLRRAGEVELSEGAWHRTWWRLTHPGLAGQLKAVLSSILTTGSEEWQDFAAAGLAIRFALDGDVAEVTELLIKVAEAPKLTPALRNRAIKASMATNPTMAAPRLRNLLASLAAETDADNDSEELVGTILSELWPDHLDLADVLPHLRPVRANSATGMYRWHLRRLPGDVAEPDIPALLTHGTHLVDQLLAPPAGSDTPEPTNFSPDLSRSPTLDDVIAPIFDRITVSPNVEEYLPALARQVSRMLLASATVPVPLGADLVDESGEPTTSSTAVRRSFAEAVILALAAEVEEFDRYHAHLALWEWKSARRGSAAPQVLRRGDRTHLLDDSDFAWLLGRVDDLRGSGENKQADAMGLVAASVADLYNPSTFELAYARRGTPEGEHFAWAFDGVALDSTLAEAMRRNTPKEKPWEHADAFASQQRDRLQSAVAGDANAFWRLTRDLRADVATGQFQALDSDDPRVLPGASLWAPEDFIAAFSVAATRRPTRESLSALSPCWRPCSVRQTRSSRSLGDEPCRVS
ncbi:NACHT domain-containing protein [Amycolatopsis sp. NPDC004747]